MTQHESPREPEPADAARSQATAAPDPHAGLDDQQLHGGGRARPRRQLPPAIVRLAGRERELARLHDALGEEPEQVTVITGMPGVGKTELAVWFARQVAERYDGGQLFLDLQPSGRAMRPEAALRILLEGLGITPAHIPEELEERAALYRATLAGRRVLVVLDNAASATQVRPLLPAGSGPLMLVTSRARLAPLDAQGTVVFRVGLGPLEQDAALELIRAVTAGHRTGDGSAELLEVARMCRGLPLALRVAAEYAAARPHVPLAEVLELLLERGRPWLEPTAYEKEVADALGSVLAFSSYRALPQDAADALRRLSVIPGRDFSLRCAAAAVGAPSERVRTLLHVLAGADLIEPGGAGRWRMHELQRAFAAAQAMAEDDEQAVRDALARVVHWHLACTDAAGQASESLRAGAGLPEAPAGLEREPVRDVASAAAWYRAECPNLLPLVLAASEAGLEEEAWRLAVALGPLHATAGDLTAWREIAEAGLDAARRCADPLAGARVQLTLATVLGLMGLTDSAEHALAGALGSFTAAGDEPGVIDAVNRQAQLRVRRRDLNAAAQLYQQVLELAERGGLGVWAGLARENLADTAWHAGQLGLAERHARAAIALYEAAGADVHMYVTAHLVIARARRAAGDLEGSANHRERAAAIVADVANNRWLEYALRFESGCWHAAAGEAERALAEYWQCTGLARDLGERTREARALTGIAGAALTLGRAQEAGQAARAASVIARRQRAGYDAADALRVLSQALDLQGDSEGAGRARAEALALLEPFTDPGAAALRAMIALSA